MSTAEHYRLTPHNSAELAYNWRCTSCGWVNISLFRTPKGCGMCGEGRRWQSGDYVEKGPKVGLHPYRTGDALLVEHGSISYQATFETYSSWLGGGTVFLVRDQDGVRHAINPEKASVTFADVPRRLSARRSDLMLALLEPLPRADQLVVAA